MKPKRYCKQNDKTLVVKVRKSSMERNDSIVQLLNAEKVKLQQEVDNLKNYIKILKKKDSQNSFMNLQPKYTQISAAKLPINNKLAKNLELTEQINRFKFSNIKLKILESDDTDNEVLYKKNYIADGITENYNFKIEFITLEYKENVKVIPCGLLMSNEYDDEEVQDVFNRSKRTESLKLLCDTLQLYAQLSKERNDVLSVLSETFPDIFKIHKDKETGHFIIKCISETQEYFECVWKIKWWSSLYSIMHAFNIAVLFRDTEFLQESSPLFETLCALPEFSDNTDHNLNIWKTIGELIYKIELRKKYGM